MATKSTASVNKVQNKSQKNEPNFRLNYLRSKDALKILRLYTKENCQSRIAKLAGFSKQKVNYWTFKLIKNGLIDLTSNGRPKFFQATSFGLKILTSSEKEIRPPCVLEDYAVKFRLLKDHGLIDWEKLGEPRNWKKMGIKVGGRIRVVKNGDSSIIIHSGRLQGFRTENLLFEAGEIIGIVLTWLRSHGIEVSSQGIPLHAPIFRFFDAEADYWNQFGTVITEEGSLDHSHQEREPHVEYLGVDMAKDYVQMPMRVRRVEAKVDDLSSRLNVVIESLSKVSALHEPLTRIVDVFESQSFKADFQDLHKREEYIS